MMLNRKIGWRLGLQFVTVLMSTSFFMALLYRPASLYHPQRRAILHLKNSRKKVIMSYCVFAIISWLLNLHSTITNFYRHWEITSTSRKVEWVKGEYSRVLNILYDAYIKIQYCLIAYYESFPFTISMQMLEFWVKMSSRLKFWNQYHCVVKKSIGWLSDAW